MSLLMDALKKAEKSKQGAGSVLGASRDATVAAPANAPSTVWPSLTEPMPAEIAVELGLPPAAPAKAPPRAEPVTNKPDTPLSLEPLKQAADPAPVLAARATPAATPTNDARVAAPPRAADRPASAEAQAADRLAAKGVFSAKTGARARGDPRSPFLAVIGALCLIGAGGAYYIWSQMQVPPPGAVGQAKSGVINAPAVLGPLATSPVSPTPPLTPAPAIGQAPLPAPGATDARADAGTTVVARAVPETAITVPGGQKPAGADLSRTSSPVVAAMPEPAVPVRPNPAAGTPPGPSTRVIGSPSSALASPSPANRSRVESATTAAPAPPPRSVVPAQANAATARGGIPVASPANLRISRDRAPAGIDPGVSAGYAALAAGNLDAARENYVRALAADATNRDALLGLAAVAMRTNLSDTAEDYYRRVLELYPRDPYASAQVASFRGGGDAAGAESRVKSLLAGEGESPSAAPLNFALGNQMAAQHRWAEAQQAYFKAYVAEPDNPDYCYNLAVSLDQIHQPRLAHEHYGRALELAKKRRAGFDLARAKLRLDQLANAGR